MSVVFYSGALAGCLFFFLPCLSERAGLSFLGGVLFFIIFIFVSIYPILFYSILFTRRYVYPSPPSFRFIHSWELRFLLFFFFRVMIVLWSALAYQLLYIYIYYMLFFDRIVFFFSFSPLDYMSMPWSAFFFLFLFLFLLLLPIRIPGSAHIGRWVHVGREEVHM